MARYLNYWRHTYIVLMAFCFCNTGYGDSADTYDLSTCSADRLYKYMCIDTGISQKKRCEAARLLAKHPDGSAWIVLRLINDDVSYRYNSHMSNESRQAKLAALAPYENAITASLIDALPSIPNISIMWALTFRLDDQGIGRSSNSEVDPETGNMVYVEYVTNPLCDLARSKLNKAIGMDYGYDSLRWRQSIMSMVQKEGEESGSREETEKERGERNGVKEETGSDPNLPIQKP